MGEFIITIIFFLIFLSLLGAWYLWYQNDSFNLDSFSITENKKLDKAIEKLEEINDKIDEIKKRLS